MPEFNSQRRLQTTANNLLNGVVCEVPECNQTPAEPGETFCDMHLLEIARAYKQYEREQV